MYPVFMEMYGQKPVFMEMYGQKRTQRIEGI
jgi:hypothetical protein